MARLKIFRGCEILFLHPLARRKEELETGDRAPLDKKKDLPAPRAEREIFISLNSEEHPPREGEREKSRSYEQTCRKYLADAKQLSSRSSSPSHDPPLLPSRSCQCATRHDRVADVS